MSLPPALTTEIPDGSHFDDWDNIEWMYHPEKPRDNREPTVEELILTYATEYYANEVTGKGSPTLRFNAAREAIRKLLAEAWSEGFSDAHTFGEEPTNPYEEA